MALIIDEINMVSLKLRDCIDTQLGQTKEKLDNNVIIFDNVSIVIVMGNFYQFASIIGRLL